MCCPGCAAVCSSILAAGLADYYRFRTTPTGRAADPVPDALIEAGVYDLPGVQQGFVSDAGDGAREAALALSGITCAACTWLIERQLRALPGVLGADVNFATQRARVRFDPARTRVSDLLAAVRGVGYQACPYDPARSEQALDNERRQRLRELGLAGVLAVQVMMLSIAAYLGEWGGMDAGIRRLFEWASLLLTVPIIAVCARPFMRAAWRDLRARSVGMDVPVSLAILVAFGASAWATARGQGSVYYDSIAMFTFLLLLARYGEFSARRRAAAGLLDTLQSLPAFARRRRDDGSEEMVPAGALASGDRVLVRAGESIPADGMVVAGTSSVDESLLTGESFPRLRGAGDEVVGGSLNVESPLEIEVRRVGSDTVLASLLSLAERARDGRPRLARIADRVASGFVLAVLVLSVVVAAWWWQNDPARALPVLVALLVATCPCALSLAMPTALVAGAGSLTRIGLLPTGADVIEGLASVDHVVLDKTGTLTLGRPRLADIRVLGECSREQCISLAAALEANSEHPLASAVREAARDAGIDPSRVDDLRNEPGSGLHGRWQAQEVFLGSPDWVMRTGDVAADFGPPVHDGASVALLAIRGRALAELRFADTPRADAGALVHALRDSGLGVTLASGDGEDAVRWLANRVGIDDWHAAQRPSDKLALVRRLQADGRRVLMLGDGVNDVPVLSAADVSVAMPEGAMVARAHADAVFLVERLPALADALSSARRTRAVVRQNIGWAVLYNVLVLPLAASGMMTPWMAALGMSASSLIVVGNALRARAQPEARRR